MSHDGRHGRARIGAHDAETDRRSTQTRRRRLGALAAFGAAATLALAACGAATSSGVAAATGSPPTGASLAPTVEPSVAPSAPTNLTVTFQEANASKIFGGAILTDLGDGSTAVTIGVVAIGFDEPMPAELASGTCADAIAAPVPSAPPAASAEPSAAASAEPSMAASEAPSAPTESTAPTPATLPAKLTDVSAGSSNTVVQLPLAELLGSPTAIVIHKSAADLTVVACADVTATAAPPTALPSALPSVPALPSDLPSTAP